MNLIPKSNHAKIKFSKMILQKENITFEDFDLVKQIIKNHISEGLSPSDIKNYYNINYTNFSTFIKETLGISLLSHKESVNNYYNKSGRSNTNEKSKYFKECTFKFNPYSDKTILGYDLLLQHGLYHPKKNKNGVCRDHIISKSYGYKNNIDPSLISSKYNCQFLLSFDNISKGEKCGFSLEELLLRIQNSSNEPLSDFNYDHVISSKSEEHKRKISETNKKYMTITNGVINKRILKTDEIPNMFRRGMTQINKK